MVSGDLFVAGGGGRPDGALALAVAGGQPGAGVYQAVRVRLVRDAVYVIPQFKHPSCA